MYVTVNDQGRRTHMRRLVVEIYEELYDKLAATRSDLESRAHKLPTDYERQELRANATTRGLVTALLQDGLDTRSLDDLQSLILRRPVKMGRPVVEPAYDPNRVKLTDKERESVAARYMAPRHLKTLPMSEVPIYKDEVDAYLGITPTPPVPEPKKRGKK